MDFKIGYTVRPRDIVNSVVIFEEEVETPEGVVYQDTLPTKDECLAYGFNWSGGDSSRPSVCSVNTVRDLPKPNNMLSASRLDILGADVNNTLVVGDTNQVEDFTNNSIVAGRLSKVSATNSIVLGGNSVDAGTIPLGDNLVENGRFNEIGAEGILNGDFSEIGGELVENGSFTPGIELVENGNFQDFADATDSNLDGGVQFADWNVNPANGKRRLTNIVDGFRNDVIVKQNFYYQQNVNQDVSTYLEVGKYYRFKATFITSDGSNMDVRISNGNGSNVQAGGNYPTEAGISQSIDIFFKCTSITGQKIFVWPRNVQEIGESFSLQNVSIKEVGQEWDIYKSGSSTVSFEDDAILNIDGSNSNVGIYQQGIFENNKIYKIDLTMKASAVFIASILESSGAAVIFTIGTVSLTTSYQNFTFYYTGTGNYDLFIQRLYGQTAGANQKIYIKDVSVKEVGQDWTLDTGWSIGDGVAVSDGTNNADILQSGSVVGKSYKATFTIPQNNAGRLSLYIGGGYVGNTGTGNAGDFTFYGKAIDTTLIRFRAALDFDGSITNISVKEVGQDWSLGGGWSIGDNKAIADGSTSTSNLLTQDLGLVATKTYKISFSSNRISGTLFVKNGTSHLSTTIYTLNTGTGLEVQTFTLTSPSNSEIGFYAYNYNGSITNLSVAEVLPYGAKRQSIQLLYGLQSTDGSNQSSFLNGITDSLFAIPENSVMYFHADVIAVRVGGTDTSGGGAVGDYGSWVERGVIINKSGVLSISRERDDIKSSGTVTNWQPTGIVDGTNFAMRVRGHTDMTIEWASNITFTEIITGVAL